MKNLIFIALLIYSSSSFSQQDFGIKVNGGVSQITAKINSSGDIVTQKFYFLPSFQAGFLYHLHLGKKSLLGTEILFMQIEGKEHMQTQDIDSYGNPTGFITTTDISRHISYLSIPIYYGYKIKKFSINFGFQVGIPIKSSARYKTEYVYNGDKIISDDNYNSLPIDNYDFGTKSGLMYNLSKKFTIETTYYYGLNNIYKSNQIFSANILPIFTMKIQQFTFGIIYKFYSREKKTSS
ncbi:MAG: PorT family protein [Bacteroidetes bacterium]|nr:PorT family protein [Bacteroidota bacterium]